MKLPPDACTLTEEKVTSRALASLYGLSLSKIVSPLVVLGELAVLQAIAGTRSAAATSDRKTRMKKEYEPLRALLIR
jgi:hypothetical protein